MHEILQATYKDGHLILNKKLSSLMEGKTVNIIVLDTDAIETKKKRFLDFVSKQTVDLPEDYTFNRETLYER
ncbi:MAG: hypothetical protein KDJ52_21730 [Anaerolineae bacterium]|nr:hypothetical protein [Anaerolineae bacterium]